MSDQTPRDTSESDRSDYQKDRRNAGKFNIAFGLIFLTWSTCDLIAGFDGWFSYADICFVLMAIAFIIYGVSQMKAGEKKQPRP